MVYPLRAEQNTHIFRFDGEHFKNLFINFAHDYE